MFLDGSQIIAIARRSQIKCSQVGTWSWTSQAEKRCTLNDVKPFTCGTCGIFAATCFLFRLLLASNSSFSRNTFLSFMIKILATLNKWLSAYYFTCFFSNTTCAFFPTQLVLCLLMFRILRRPKKPKIVFIQLYLYGWLTFCFHFSNSYLMTLNIALHFVFFTISNEKIF